MNRSLSIVIIILPLINLSGCNDGIDLRSELEKLPPATAEGKNTFGCLVNGKAWVIRSSIDATAFYQMDVFQMNAVIEEKERHQGILLAVLGGLNVGTRYDLTNDPKNQAGFGWQQADQNCQYDIDKTVSGELRILTLNESKFIVAGTFEFVTVSPGCDTVVVTDGRFDIVYAP